MDNETTQPLDPSDAEPEMDRQQIALATLDELSGIRTALVSMLQLVCSVPPFKGAIAVSEDGEIHQIPGAKK